MGRGMLHKLLLVLIVIITLLSLVTVVTLFGLSVTGSTVKSLDSSVITLSFVIGELIIIALIALIVGLIRFRRRDRGLV
ncbi:MAG: hypothetical protein ABIB47_02945 [Candidatus Woesearchaeota archaeon]